MINVSGSGLLRELYDKKQSSDAEKKRVIVVDAALHLIMVALQNTNGGHRLAEEMNNLETYVAKIESVL